MTNKDILKAFSGLDADTVIACAPGGAPQRKNRLVLRVVAIAACLALLVSTVVVSTLLLNREDENQPDVPSELTEPNNEKKKYEMYMNFSTGENSDMNISANENVEFKPISEKTFIFSKKTKIEKPENVVDNRDITIGEKAYSLNYSRSYITPLIDSPFKELGQYNEYRSNNAITQFTAETNKLCFFMDFEVEKLSDGNFSPEMAEEASKELAEELYGVGTLDDYECSIYVDETEVVAHYSRKIFGFASDDNVTFTFNKNGEIVSINALKMGTMAFASENIAKEDIENAIKVATETFEDGWTLDTPTLVIDSVGDYYARIGMIKRNGDSFVSSVEVYVNLK